MPLPEARPFCDWWTDYGDWNDVYHTECGHDFEFTTEPPHNWMKFCCYCGGILRIKDDANPETE